MSRNKPKRVNQYKIDNEEYLKVRAAEPDVTVLENGVILRWLEQGHGTIHPRPGSLVYAHYTGRLIDGTVFDTTEGENLPALFRVRDLIMGWQIALVRMYEGDRYEVTIPAKWGYGSIRAGDIPAYSTLIFDLSLVKIAQI